MLHDTDVVIKISNRIEELAHRSTPVLVAIDGRCASGKSTLASKLYNTLSCSLFHMDDFYLQAHQRTEARLSEPGGNVDRERFRDEVLKNLKSGVPFSYRPFNCQTMGLSEPVDVTPSKINIVEGSYSLHPELSEYYDLRIFLTTGRDEQLRRIEKRNPGRLNMFMERWIPLEEKYFEAFNIEAKCDIVITSLNCPGSCLIHFNTV